MKKKNTSIRSFRLRIAALPLWARAIILLACMLLNFAAGAMMRVGMQLG